MATDITTTTSQVALQSMSGVALGTAIDQIFSNIFPSSSSVSSHNAIMTGFEIFAQAAVGAVTSVGLMDFTSGRGYGFDSSVIGAATYWTFFWGFQPNFTSKVSSMVRFMNQGVDSLMDSAQSTAQKSTSPSITQPYKDVSIAMSDNVDGDVQ